MVRIAIEKPHHRMVLFKLNHWTLDDWCAMEVLEHPEQSTMASICRDYWYAKRAERDAS